MFLASQQLLSQYFVEILFIWDVSVKQLGAKGKSIGPSQHVPGSRHVSVDPPWKRLPPNASVGSKNQVWSSSEFIFREFSCFDVAAFVDAVSHATLRIVRRL